MFHRYLLVVSLVFALCPGGPASAAIVEGCVLRDENCDGTKEGGIAGVTVLLKQGETVLDTAVSDDGGIGLFRFDNVADGDYQLLVEIPTGSVFGSTECTALSPSACGPQDANPMQIHIERGGWIKPNFLLCRSDSCWMTAGGVKFEPATETFNVQVNNGNGRNKKDSNGNGPRDSVGGVVFPSCAQHPSNGGNWNHLAHQLGLHLLGKDVFTVRCGNVDGIEPGTESPVCSVNFIEFRGAGIVQGVGGNKIDDIPVTFFGRIEDHDEPGNDDRYFLRVVDANGVLVLLIDEDGVDDGAVDPRTTTGGNFQIHCTSCDDGDGAGGSLQSRYAEGLRQGTFFLRGDLNIDGGVDVSDAIYGLNYLFGGASAPRCLDAADANDDGRFNVADSIALLNGLFADGSISAPFPVAGIDRTIDGLDCGLLLR